jgi:hypothetical protein
MEKQMNDIRFMVLDDSLPTLLEKLNYNVDWESDKERNNYYRFRNDLEKLMDKYYGGKI